MNKTKHDRKIETGVLEKACILIDQLYTVNLKTQALKRQITQRKSTTVESYNASLDDQARIRNNTTWYSTKNFQYDRAEIGKPLEHRDSLPHFWYTSEFEIQREVKEGAVLYWLRPWKQDRQTYISVDSVDRHHPQEATELAEKIHKILEESFSFKK